MDPVSRSPFQSGGLNFAVFNMNQIATEKIKGVDLLMTDRCLIFFNRFILLIYLLIYSLAALGLRCCMQAPSCCGEWGATPR